MSCYKLANCRYNLGIKDIENFASYNKRGHARIRNLDNFISRIFAFTSGLSLTLHYYPAETLRTKDTIQERFIQEYLHNCIFTARYTIAFSSSALEQFSRSFPFLSRMSLARHVCV